jgi:hypothetical protein
MERERKRKKERERETEKEIGIIFVLFYASSFHITHLVSASLSVH